MLSIEPRKRRENKELEEEREEKAARVPLDVRAFIQSSIASGETTISEWVHVVEDLQKECEFNRGRDTICKSFPGPFAGSPVEAVARSIKLKSLEQEEGNDSRYDRSKATATFSLNIKDQPLELYVSTNYSQQDGINLLLQIQRPGEPSHEVISLTDCSGDHSYDWWQFLWVEEKDLIHGLQKFGLLKAKVSARKMRFVKCLCWLFNALISCTSPEAETLENATVKERVSAALTAIAAE